MSAVRGSSTKARYTGVEADDWRATLADREARFAAGEHICIGCGRTPVETFGGLCIECDAKDGELAERPLEMQSSRSARKRSGGS